jgi:hypothetical protein
VLGGAFEGVWTKLGSNALARRVILILDEPPNRQMTVSKFGVTFK